MCYHDVRELNDGIEWEAGRSAQWEDQRTAGINWELSVCR